MHVLQLTRKLGYSKRELAASVFARTRGAYTALLTTDVSARGIDYTGVTRVIQFGVPSTADGYLHRIGRTARAGATGRADLVLLPFELDYLHGDPFRGQRAKPLTVKALEDDVLALAAAADAEHTVPSRPPPARFTASVDQTSAVLPPDVAGRLASLPAVLARGLPSVPEVAVQHAFNSLVGFYSHRTGVLWRRFPAVLKALVAFVREGCGYDADPVERLPNRIREALGMDIVEREEKLFGRQGGSTARARGRAPRSSIPERPARVRV
jgi:ATP-dependent RNA helicase MSS116